MSRQGPGFVSMAALHFASIASGFLDVVKSTIAAPAGPMLRHGKRRRATHARRSCLNGYGSSGKHAGYAGKVKHPVAHPMIVVDGKGYMAGTMIDGKVRNWRAGPRCRHRCSSLDEVCINCGLSTEELFERQMLYCPVGTIPVDDMRRAADLVGHAE